MKNNNIRWANPIHIYCKQPRESSSRQDFQCLELFNPLRRELKKRPTNLKEKNGKPNKQRNKKRQKRRQKNHLLQVLLPENFHSPRITIRSLPQPSKYSIANLVLSSLRDVGQDGHEGAHIPTDHGNPTINGNRDSNRHPAIHLHWQSAINWWMYAKVRVWDDKI